MIGDIEVQRVTPLEPFKAEVHFTDGSERVIDLEPYLHGKVFEPIHSSAAFFQSMSVADGRITWPNGADIDPDVLYLGLKPAWMVDVSMSDAERQR